MNKVTPQIRKLLAALALLGCALLMAGAAGSAPPHTTAGAADLGPADFNSRTVFMASHHGTYAGGALTWKTRLLLTDWAHPDDVTLRLVYPLPASTRVLHHEPEDAQVLRAADGTIVAFHIVRPTMYADSARFTLRVTDHPLDHLRPPLVAGQATQRITLEGARYTPDANSAVRRFPGYLAQTSVTDDKRKWCNDNLDMPSQVTGVPVFVRADRAFLDAGGLRGDVVSERAHRREQLIVFVVGFVGVALLLALTYVLLTNRARHEAAEAFLEGLG